MPEEEQGGGREPARRWKIEDAPSPASDEGGTKPLFHVGCGTLSLAAIIGYPLGAALSVVFFGEQGFGGFFGILAMMLVFGFFNRRFQAMAERGYRLPGVFGDRVFWASIGIGAFFGYFFGPGGAGLLPGMLAGLAFYFLRRLFRR